MRYIARASVFALLLSALVACEGDETSDAGVDTGPADTGPADTGPADTGPVDTGPADTGAPDASGDAGDAAACFPTDYVCAGAGAARDECCAMCCSGGCGIVSSTGALCR